LPDILWCEVPPGPFVMGDGGEQHRNETITEGYLISRYPITNAQFAAFVEAGGYQEEQYWTEAQQVGVWKDCQIEDRLDDYPREGPYNHGDPLNLPNHPVVGVTWYEGLAFCRWLEEQLLTAVGRLRVWRDGHTESVGSMPAAITVQLPSEAEWEKAARGTHGRRFPWGDEADANRANYRDTGIGTTTAVGCFPGGASPYGVEDLSGNVWEWTRSQAKAYPYDPEDGREDLDAGEDVARVLRGGSFNYPAGHVCCTGRDGYFPSVRYWSTSFRVVVAPFSPDLDL
jgi:formylglycine-generating enzyme required for sulfatase activity